MSEQRHIIADPFPETIGCSALTISAPEDFRGDVEIVWWYPGKSADADRQRITCSATALLQGVFRDVRGARPGELFDARVVALMLHAFYRARIEAAAQLPAAYQWRPYDTQPTRKPDPVHAIAQSKRSLGPIMDLAWMAYHDDSVLSQEDFENVSHAAATLRQTIDKIEKLNTP